MENKYFLPLKEIIDSENVKSEELPPYVSKVPLNYGFDNEQKYLMAYISD